jgi:hypothetical protein
VARRPKAPADWGDAWWVAGEYLFDGHAYVWVPGHWDHRPRPVAKWIGGHWEGRPHGKVWIAGHWD